MLYLVVEHFRDGDPRPVYARAREHGRLMPDGLRYVASWVSDDLRRCWQVMECDERASLDAWIARWSDLVDFEVHPVITSADAAARAAASADAATPMRPTQVRLAEHDPAWAARFAAERERLRAAFGALPAEIEHVGSTAVPGLPAKPILDLLVGRPPGDVAPYVEVLQRAGYTYRGEHGLPGRHYFHRGEPRTHHLHLVERGSARWHDHLAFRDRLRADPALAAAYAALKRRLAATYPEDRAAYTDAKGPFIERVLRGAPVDGRAP